MYVFIYLFIFFFFFFWGVDFGLGVAAICVVCWGPGPKTGGAGQGWWGGDQIVVVFEMFGCHCGFMFCWVFLCWWVLLVVAWSVGPGLEILWVLFC